MLMGKQFFQAFALELYQEERNLSLSVCLPAVNDSAGFYMLRRHQTILEVCLPACPSVCLHVYIYISIYIRSYSIHLIYFTLGRYIAEDQGHVVSNLVQFEKAARSISINFK